jgi:autotransporter-associated beta strand protein
VHFIIPAVFTAFCGSASAETLQEFYASYPLTPLRSYTFLGTENSVHELWGTTNRYSKPVVWDNGVIEGWFDPANYVSWVGAAKTASSFDFGLVDDYLPAVFYTYRKVGATNVTCEMTAFAMDHTNTPGAVFVYVSLIQKSNGVAQATNCYRLSDNAPTDYATFTNQLQALRSHWEQFFTGCTVPPCDDPDVLNACKASLARSLISYTGMRPHYGVRSYGPNTVYGNSRGDGFAPTTIAMVDCLLDWGLAAKARDYLTYYFDNLVDASGIIDYGQPGTMGSSISEYGQLLWLVRKCKDAGGSEAWLDHLRPKVEAIRTNLWAAQASSPNGLIVGLPEADLRTPDWHRYWFHNNGWAWRGLSEIATLLNHDGESTRLNLFRDIILASIAQYTDTGVTPAFISPEAAVLTPFPTMPNGDLPSYTNIRFWWELLSCDILSTQQMNDIINYRLTHNGEIGGLGRMRRTGSSGDPWGNNWMVAEYAAGLKDMGQTGEVRRLLLSFLAGNMTRETSMSYEMVKTYTNGTFSTYETDYCTTAQLVSPRLLAWLNGDTVRFAATNPVADAHFCFWDINGTNAGAGGAGSPSGAWDDSATNWNTDANGEAGGSLFSATSISNDIVFCAGTDAVGAYTVTLGGTQQAASLTFEDGSAMLTGGVVNLPAIAPVWVESGLTAVVASALSGAGSGIVKSGAGALKLTDTNIVVGGFTIIGGTLEIGGAGRLGGGVFSGNLSAGGTFVYSSTASQTLRGAISGSGALIKSGPGTLALATNTSFSGGILVNGGELLLTGPANANACTSVTVNAGATLRYGAPDQIVAAKVTLNGGAFDLGTNRDHIGTLTLSNGGQVRTAGINANHHLYVFGATGQIYAAGASNVIGSDIAMTSFYGGNPGNRTQNIDVGEGGTLDLTGRLRDAPPYGIAYIGSLRKTGSGLLTLSATNGYSGATTINGGTLSVNGLTPGLVTVQNAATLGGSGRVGSVIVESGGRVAPGTSIGALTASNVTWNAGTAWLFELGATNQGDRLECLGSFLQGSGSEFHFDFQGTGAAGVYTLVTWAASSDFDGGSFFADNPAAGLTPVFAIDANALTLTLTGSGGGGSSESTNASIRVSGGQVTVGISIASGALYRVQGNANLLNGAGWTNLTGQLTNQSVGNAVFSDPESAVLPARSYRVISP